jgi:purine nucleosidase/pyrimidine-specific ribonucleoside hydrolase
MTWPQLCFSLLPAFFACLLVVATAAPIKIILDTDIGNDGDDGVALALALRSPELEIVAITTVGGNSRERAMAAKKLAIQAGKPNIPVYPGEVQATSNGSLPSVAPFALGLLNPLETYPVENETAVDALIRLFSGSESYELIMIG